MEEVGIRVLYAEFSYNNSYQQSLKMAPFVVLYGRMCQTLLFWSETNGQFSNPAFCKRPTSKFIWLGKTYELRNQGRRAMPIIGEET
jgi:hypothetical protein